MILGFSWLKKHNPEIDFRASTIKMTRCLPHCCVGCKAKWKMERDTKKREGQQINVCHASPFPAFIEDTEDELKDGEFEVPLEEKIETPLNKDDKPLEEGNRIWATGLFSEAEQIWATASISQRLAEGFQQNSTSLTFDKSIPPHL